MDTEVDTPHTICRYLCFENVLQGLHSDFCKMDLMNLCQVNKKADTSELTGFPSNFNNSVFYCFRAL